MTEAILSQLSIIRRRQVQAKTGLGRSTIYDRINPKSPRFDPSFPTPVHLGNGAAVGWIDREVDTWIQSRIANRSATCCPQPNRGGQQ